MSNALIKRTLASYSPGSPGVPADPGRPYTPAHWETRTTTICTVSPVYVGAADDDSLNVGAPSSPYINIYSCHDETTSEYVPAQPYRAPSPAIPAAPAQTIYDYQLGWNASARSEAMLIGDGDVRFKVPISVAGVVVGLVEGEVGTGYSAVTHGFYLSHGVVSVVERGAVKLALGNYSSDFMLRRRGGEVRYWVDGVERHTSIARSDAHAFLGAALYSGGDSVFDPAVSMALDMATALEPFAGVSSGYGFVPTEEPNWTDTAGAMLPFWGWSNGHALGGASVSGNLLPFTGLSGAAPYADVVGGLAPFVGQASDRRYGSVVGSMAPFAAYAEGGLVVPTYAVASGPMLPFTGVSIGLTGEIGNVSAEMRPFDGRCADRPYGEVNGALRPFAGVAFAYEGPTNATIFSMGRAASVWSAGTEIAIALNSTGEVASVFAVETIIEASFDSTAHAASVHALQAVLGVVLMSYGAGASAEPMDSPTEVWVVNTETSGSTRYENYGFNSFARIGDTYYGARRDGLYALDGDTDDGAAVQAMVSFGKQDFGTSTQKRIDACYLGASSTGRLFLRVVADGYEYTYAARSSSETLAVQRVDVGRGLKANWLEFELYNADGDDFELASAEFAAVALSRRI